MFRMIRYWLPLRVQHSLACRQPWLNNYCPYCGVARSVRRKGLRFPYGIPRKDCS